MISTPTNPRISADQRWMPTFSFRIAIDSRVVNTSTSSRLPVDASDPTSPIIFYDRRATCWNPQVKGLTLMVNSLFNGWRMEDVWLDQ